MNREKNEENTNDAVKKKWFLFFIFDNFLGKKENCFFWFLLVIFVVLFWFFYLTDHLTIGNLIHICVWLTIVNSLLENCLCIYVNYDWWFLMLNVDNLLKCLFSLTETPLNIIKEIISAHIVLVYVTLKQKFIIFS